MYEQVCKKKTGGAQRKTKGGCPNLSAVIPETLSKFRRRLTSSSNRRASSRCWRRRCLSAGGAPIFTVQWSGARPFRPAIARLHSLKTAAADQTRHPRSHCTVTLTTSECSDSLLYGYTRRKMTHRGTPGGNEEHNLIVSKH